MTRAAVFLILLGGCGIFGDGEAPDYPEEVTPGVSSKDSPEVDVVLDGGASQLGGYELEIVFNPRAGRLLAIEGGRTFGFDRRPEFDPASFPSGHVRVSAFHTMPASAEGEVHVMTLRFAAAPAPAIEVRGLKVYDCRSREMAARPTVRPHAKTP